MTELSVVPKALEPNKRIIELVREILRDAKAGKVHAIGIAVAIQSGAVGSDGGRATESTLSFTPGWSHSLSAAVNGLAFRLNYERYTKGCALPDPVLSDDDE